MRPLTTNNLRAIFFWWECMQLDPTCMSPVTGSYKFLSSPNRSFLSSSFQHIYIQSPGDPDAKLGKTDGVRFAHGGFH